MAFTTTEKTDIRRYCGYSVYGALPVQGFGYRFFTWEGNLEYKLNNLLAEEETVIRNTYLTNLNQLETDIVGVRANLDTDKAAVWTHNKNEQQDRENLFNSWRKKLCEFLGIPPGPGLQTGIRRVI